MFRKITAIILGAVMAASSCVCAVSAVSAAEPVQTESVVREYGAVVTEWNGKTALKSGGRYVVSKSVTVSKKITVPEGATLTVKKGGKLTVGTKGSLYVKGSFSVSGGASATISGKLYLYKGSKLGISGSLKLGTKSTATLKGAVTVYVNGKLSGSPKKLTLSDSAALTVKGSNTCSKLEKAINKRDVAALYSNFYTKMLKDNDSLMAYMDSYPEDYIANIEKLLDGTGYTFADFCKLMDGEIAENKNSEGIVKVKSVKVELKKYTDITKKSDEDIKSLLSNGYGKVDKVWKIELKVTVTPEKGSAVVENVKAVTAKSGGRWYLVD